LACAVRIKPVTRGSWTALPQLAGGAAGGQVCHSVLDGEITFAGKASAGSQLTLGDAVGNVIGHLHVDVRDLVRVDR
jgi:hypothetical protein